MTSLKYNNNDTLTARPNQIIATEHENVGQQEIDVDGNSDTSLIFQGFECDAVYDLLTWDEKEPNLNEESEVVIEPIKRKRKEQICVTKEKKTKKSMLSHYSDYKIKHFDELNNPPDQHMLFTERKKEIFMQTASEANDVFHESSSDESQHSLSNALVDTAEGIKMKRREQLCHVNESNSKNYVRMHKNRSLDHDGIMKQLNEWNNPCNQDKQFVPKHETFFFRTASPSKDGFSELSSEESQPVMHEVLKDTAEPRKRKRRGTLISYQSNDFSSELSSDEFQQSVLNQESADIVEPMVWKRREQSCLIRGKVNKERREQLNNIKKMAYHKKCGSVHDESIDQLVDGENPSNEDKLLLPKEIPITTSRSKSFLSELHEDILIKFEITMKRSEVSRGRLIEFERKLPQSLLR